MIPVAAADAFLSNKVLNTHYSIQNGFRPGRAAGHVHVHGHYLVNPLQHTVTVEDATTAGAGANGHYPSWFGHLEIDLFHHGGHFLGNSTHDHQQVALAG